MHNGAMNIEFDPNKNALNIRKHGINLADVDMINGRLR
jgi:uncharacterized DUF497 family protein